MYRSLLFGILYFSIPGFLQAWGGGLKKKRSFIFCTLTFPAATGGDTDQPEGSPPRVPGPNPAQGLGSGQHPGQGEPPHSRREPQEDSADPDQKSQVDGFPQTAQSMEGEK